MSNRPNIEQLLQEILKQAQKDGSLSNSDLAHLQTILSNVQVGGDLSVGNITQTLLNLTLFIPTSFKPSETPHNIPNTGAVKFVGRTDVLENLHQTLQAGNQVVLSALEGMGGVGKTELAIQYSQLHLLLGNYPGGICWLRARDEDIGFQVKQFARVKLGLELPENLELLDQVNFCWSHWQEGDVLIVLDDVNDYKKIQPYLPPQPSRFKILLTTRLQLNLTQSLTVDVLDETAALELLEEWIGAVKVEEDLVNTKELCQRLGYLPLAINLAGRYLQRRKISIVEMLRRLNEKGLKHPSLEIDQNDRTHVLRIERGVASAFALSWEELSESAKRLGCLLSLFALAPIPWAVVESIESEQSPEAVEDARVELESLYLLQNKDVYTIHQLIREFLQDKLEQFSEVSNLKKNFIKVFSTLAKKIPDHRTLTFEAITEISPIIPHLEIITREMTDCLNEEELSTIFIGLFSFYYIQETFTLADSLGKRYLEIVKGRFGEEHINTASGLNNLAIIYQVQGKFEEAILLLTEALKIAQKLLPLEHRDSILMMHNLAGLYRNQGQYSESQSLLNQAHKHVEALMETGNGDVVLELFDSQSSLFLHRGEPEQARDFVIAALEFKQRMFGLNHPSLLTSLGLLAQISIALEDYSQAELLALQALELSKNMFGEQHSSIAHHLNTLAEIYRKKKDDSKAEEAYLKALEIYESLIESRNFSDSYERAYVMDNLGLLYQDQGRISDAERLHKQALEQFQAFLGINHVDVAICMSNLSALYYSQENFLAAESLCLQALEIFQNLHGPDHIQIATSLGDLARLRIEQGKFEEAKTLLLQTWQMEQRLSRANQPQVSKNLDLLVLLCEVRATTLLNRLAATQDSKENSKLAERLRIQSQQIRLRHLGPEYLDTSTDSYEIPEIDVAESLAELESLATYYFAQRRDFEAEELYTQVWQMRQQLLQAGHPHLVLSPLRLADLYQFQGRYSQALSLYFLALSTSKRLPEQEHHSLTINVLENLAHLYISQENYTTAATLLLEILEISERQLGINHPDTDACRANLKNTLRQAFDDGFIDYQKLPNTPTMQAILTELQANSGSVLNLEML